MGALRLACAAPVGSKLWGAPLLLCNHLVCVPSQSSAISTGAVAAIVVCTAFGLALLCSALAFWARGRFRQQRLYGEAGEEKHQEAHAFAPGAQSGPCMSWPSICMEPGWLVRGGPNQS